MDKIKIKVLLPTNDLKDTEYKEIIINQDGLGDNYDMIFSYKIPDYIYDDLVDTEEKYISYENFKTRKKDINYKGSSYLKRTIKYPLISMIKEEIEKLTSSIIVKNTRNELQKTKKIFVKYFNNEKHSRCEWTGGYMGESISSSFQYFIGYEIEEKSHMTDKLVKNYYTLIKYVPINGTTRKLDTNFKEGDKLEPLYMPNDKNSFLNSYTILDWSQQREEFFEKVNISFKNINNKISEYLTNLDNDKIDLLISNNTNLLN